MWNRLGFRDRLQLVGFGLMVLMLLAVAGGASTLVDRHLRVELQARAQQMAPLFNAALGAPMAQRDYASVAAIVEEIRGSRELVYVDVLDTAGRSITAQRAAASAEGQPKLSDDTLPFSTPLELGGQRLGSVEFGLSREAIDKTRHSILVGISLLSAAALAVFSVAVALLGTAVTRPLKALITAARDIQAGHYEVDLDTTRKDEFGVLMKTFGKMTQEIRRKVSELVQSESLQRRYLQESTTALQEAQAANRVKAEFIANMSHEIRTPMNSIMGYADLLRLTPLGPQQAAYVTRLHESGGAMLALINDILDFSRIEAGQLKSGTESFSLPPLIETVCGLLMPALSEKGLVLQSSIDPEIPADLLADRQRLQQVLLNLLGNAVKFTLHGQINVEVKRVQAPAHTPPTGTQPLWLRIAVRDTGIGIAPEQLEQVFQPFAQADGSITRRFGGTGLGLSISRSLAELMGGHLKVQSELGVGSEFAIVFPCTPAAGPERIQPDTAVVEPDQMADVGRSPFTLALDAPPDGRAAAQTAAPAAPSTTAHPMSAAQQTSGLEPAKRQALQAPLLELERALEGKMMRARQLAEDIAAGLQDTAAAQAFAPVLADTQRLRFNQARDRLRAFSHWLQSP
jgi:signal transduction histidine kinase